jgi:hypothetical protein
LCTYNVGLETSSFSNNVRLSRFEYLTEEGRLCLLKQSLKKDNVFVYARKCLDFRIREKKSIVLIFFGTISKFFPLTRYEISRPDSSANFTEVFHQRKFRLDTETCSNALSDFYFGLILN